MASRYGGGLPGNAPGDAAARGSRGMASSRVSTRSEVSNRLPLKRVVRAQAPVKSVEAVSLPARQVSPGPRTGGRGSSIQQEQQRILEGIRQGKHQTAPSRKPSFFQDVVLEEAPRGRVKGTPAAPSKAQRRIEEQQQEKVAEASPRPVVRVFRERFVIRWYEVRGSRSKATVETIANLLQESATGHAAAAGYTKDGLASTPEMSRLRLLWIFAKMHIRMDEYPKWGDVVEIETWMQLESSVSSRRDWIIRLPNENRVIGRATGCMMMMNQDTRRISRIPPSVQEELAPHCPSPPRFVFDSEEVPKIPKLEIEEGQGSPQEGLHAIFSKSNLTPRRADLDMNQHVNNVAYISWMLEALPQSLLDEAELAQLTVEYRRECHHSDLVQSLAQQCPERGEGGAEEGALAAHHSSAQEHSACPVPVRSASAHGADIGRQRGVPGVQGRIGLHINGTAQAQALLGANLQSPPVILPSMMLLSDDEDEQHHGEKQEDGDGDSASLSFVHVLRLQDPNAESGSWKDMNKGHTVWRPIPRE